MATQEAIATLRANALRDLKDTGAAIAQELGIDPPRLDFFYPSKDYQQAEELKALVDFNTRVLSALQTPPEGEENELSGGKTVSKRRSDRTTVS